MENYKPQDGAGQETLEVDTVVWGLERRSGWETEEGLLQLPGVTDEVWSPAVQQSWAQSQDPEVGHLNVWAETSAGTQRGLGGQHQGDMPPRKTAPPSYHVWEQGRKPNLRRGW